MNLGDLQKKNCCHSTKKLKNIFDGTFIYTPTQIGALVDRTKFQIRFAMSRIISYKERPESRAFGKIEWRKI